MRSGSLIRCRIHPGLGYSIVSKGSSVMKAFHMAFPSDWESTKSSVADLRSRLFGEVPDIDAIDISGIGVPPPELSAMIVKNVRKLRNQVSLDEMVSSGSPYRTVAFFDDQLLDIVESISDKYDPIEYICQMIKFIEIFVNVGACFRTAAVEDRLSSEDATIAVEKIREAVEIAKNTNVRDCLVLLLLDFTDGGEAPWVSDLCEADRHFIETVLRDSALSS